MGREEINTGLSPATSPLSENQPQYDEKLDSRIHAEGVDHDHHYDTKVQNMTGVSELPLYPVERRDGDAGSLKEEVEIEAELDLYKPFPLTPDIAHEEHILTFRALIVGIILGSLVNCSNLYLGLKTGFTFGSSMFGAIFGFGILKAISTAVPHKFPILGGTFGPQENSIVQAAAVGAGGMGTIFVASLPAMYQLELLGTTPKQDIGRIFTLTIISSYFGLFMVTPLRKFFIIQVGKELSLIFPTATATAMTIRSMHTVGSGADDAMKKLKGLLWAFGGSLVHRVVSYYCIGILYDWHIFTWFYIWSGHKNWAMNIENWGWFIEWTPAFLGSGMLIGLNSAISMFIGSFLAWGVIGPLTVHYGETIGVNGGYDEPWQDITYFTSLKRKDGVLPSPRYWLLWPGVMVMVCASLAELFIQYKVIGFAMKTIWNNTNRGLHTRLQKRGKHVAFFEKHANLEGRRDDLMIEDFASKEDQVKIWQWSTGLLVTLVMSIIILQFQWDMNAGLTILASLLGFIFAFLCIQIGGVTDVTPLTAAAKASQLIFGGVTKGTHSVADAQRINLIAGTVSAGAAGVAMDLVSDFRTGFLLRTPPKQQWRAQAIGTFISIWLAPGIFVLFASAYPCILTGDDPKCAFSAPSVAAWAAVAKAVTQDDSGIPLNSGILAICLGAWSVIQAVIRHYYFVGEREKHRKWLPNWGAIALAFVVPATTYMTAALMGAVFAYFWQKKSPRTWEIYGYAIAAGFIAGEGLGGTVGAVLQLANVAGDRYGTNIACPADSC